MRRWGEEREGRRKRGRTGEVARGRDEDRSKASEVACARKGGQREVMLREREEEEEGRTEVAGVGVGRVDLALHDLLLRLLEALLERRLELAGLVHGAEERTEEARWGEGGRWRGSAVRVLRA